ncbi:MAG TPA: bifunctional precorrin-2 dehydrogenase/sirohydrochlorin ferrochelatase [Acidimicrobiales bacterium]|nr:bifunctional precorrin-2 dehydrogenase/sirohydrochlorin ferrochelatase [Acidimicrobiales bacterium]
MPNATGPAAPPYPVVLAVAGLRCLVVGGGRVAARKVAGLLASAAEVTVVAPVVDRDLAALAAEGRLRLERRPYRPGEAAAHRLVLTATGVAEVDGLVAADAEAAGVFVNRADHIAGSTFLLPAVERRGPVSVAVSTGGASPALAAWLRRRLAAALPAGLPELADLLAEARQDLGRAGRSTDVVDWAALLDGPLPDLVAAGDLGAARELLARAVGGAP